MSGAVGASIPGPSPVTSVEARIGAIRARIDGLVGAAPGRAVPVFDLPATVDELPAAAGRATAEQTPSAAPSPTAPTTMASVVSTDASVPSTGDARGATLAARLPEHGRDLAAAVERAAVAAGIEPSLLAAVVRHESDFDQSVVSRAGAIGLAQLMPGTAASLGVDPHHPGQNLAGGARYLREQLDRFGSAELALAAYNAGPNRVAQAGGVPRIAETETYVRRVMSTWEQWR